MKCHLVKLAAGMKRSAPARKAKAGDAAPAAFVFTTLTGPGGTSTVELFGTDGTMNGPPDSAGNPTPTQIDISSVASISALVSSDPTTVSVAAGTTPVQYVETPVKAGTGTIVSGTVTWTDGSVGPFNFTDPVDVVLPPPPPPVITGLVVVHLPGSVTP